MKRRTAFILGIAMLFSLCSPLTASASNMYSAEHQQQYIDYLLNWSYTDGDSTATIYLDGFSDETMQEIFSLDFDELNEYLINRLYWAIENDDTVIEGPPISPYGVHYGPWGYELVDFEFGGGTLTREWGWRIYLVLVFNGGQIGSMTDSGIEFNFGGNITYQNYSRTTFSFTSTYATAAYRVTLACLVDGFTVATANRTVLYTYYV